MNLVLGRRSALAGLAGVGVWHFGTSITQQEARSMDEFKRQAPLRRTSMTDLRKKSMAVPSEHSPVLVGIAGGTGSGKTTVAESISSRLRSHGDRVVHICHDSYYKPLDHLTIDERAKTNFDHPDALDTELMTLQLRSLKMGHTIHVPTCASSTLTSQTIETDRKS